ncbi:MAG: cupin domain-containing protein [Chloroflexota bacterium]
MENRSDKTAQGYILQAGEGLSGDSSLKASAASTAGGLTVIESKTTGGAPLHVHTREDEYFYVLEGILSIRLGDETFEAGARSFVFLPRNVPHEWDVIGEEATLLLLTAPAGLDAFLNEYHAAESKEARDQVAAKYGIRFL